MREDYRFRKSDFKIWKLDGLINYSKRNLQDYSFKVDWRGIFLAATNLILPIAVAIGLGFATTIYFERNYEKNKLIESINQTADLEKVVQEINLKYGSL